MPTQRRLNKNLVVFLTVMGMLLVISVAALIIWQGAQRDPELLAQKARDLEQTGDLEQLGQAIRLYTQAYMATEGRESKYMLDAARCAFQMGAFSQWLGTLQKENAKYPQDPRILVAILEGLWRVKEVEGRGFWWSEWANYGTRLLQLDTAERPLELKDKLLGLVCRAWGLWNLTDVRVEDIGDTSTGGRPRLEAVLAAYGRTGDEAASAAFKLAPQDPRAALTYAELLVRNAREQLRAASGEGATLAELRSRQREVLTQVADVLGAAVAENPGDPQLVISYVDTLRQTASLLRTDEPDAFGNLLARAGEVLERALHERPDSPELNVGMAQQLLTQFEVQRAALPVNEADDLLSRAQRAAQRAVELDPAMYPAYSLLARMKLLAPDAASAGTAPTLERFDAALRVYEEAQARTLTLQNLRAILNQQDRLVMLLRAYETALAGLELAERAQNTEQTASLRQRAKGFLDDAVTKWPETPVADYMNGTYALLTGDSVAAIRALERAHEKSPQAAWWLLSAGVNATPAEQLMLLYQRAGQLGEAQKYGEVALRQYEQEIGRLPPVRVVTGLATLYRQQLDQPRGRQLARDLLTRYVDAYGETERRIVRAALAETLTELGLKNEAARYAEEAIAGEETTAAVLWQARLAAEQQDYATAEELGRRVLADEQATDAQVQLALQLLVSVLDATERRADARALVDQFLAAGKRPALERSLRAYAAYLAETDPQKRDETLMRLIAEEADPAVRAERLAEAYVLKRDYVKAVEQLAEARRLRPDDLALVDREFRLRLSLGQMDRAAELLVLLSQAQGGQGRDGAGGATYRGLLALAQGNSDLAIREFRAAERLLPKSAELLTNLARAYLQAGRQTEAIEALNRAIAINPRYADAYGLLTDTCDSLAAKAVGPEHDEYAAQASRAFDNLAKLAPRHPYVVARQKRAAENANPRAAIAERQQRRAEKPDDVDNLLRLGELYREAAMQARRAGDDPGRLALVDEAETFFTEALGRLTGVPRFQLAEMASQFFSEAQETARGEQFLRRLVQQCRGAERVYAQVVLAQFFERQNNAQAAEQELQTAQALLSSEVSDPAERADLELRVGFTLIDFYQRWSAPPRLIEVCRWLLDRLPAQHEAVQAVRQRLIDGLINASALDEAEREIKTYFDTYGEDLQGLTLRARLYMGRNQREQARADLTALLQKDPDNGWAYMARGWLSLQQARYDEARDDLLTARAKLPPRSPLENRLRALLAKLYEATEKFSSAVEEQRALVQNLIASAGASPEQLRLAVDELVRLHSRAQQLDAAQRLVSEYMERYPDDPHWPLLLGQLLETRADAARKRNETAAATQDYNAAANAYQRAADKAARSDPPVQLQALAARISVLRKGPGPRDAIAFFRSLPLERPAPPLRLAVARAYWDLQQREEAVAQWRAALADASLLAIQNAAAVAAELRAVLLPGDAEQLVRGVLESLPPDSDAALRLRVILGEMLAVRLSGSTGVEAENVRREALALLDDVLKKTRPDAPEHVGALATRARVLDASGDVAGAIATYEEILALDQNDQLALNNVAYLLVTAQDPKLLRPQTALRYAERLEAMVGESREVGNMLDTIGWVYYRYAVLAGKDYTLSDAERRSYLERAAAALERALRLDPGVSLAAYEHLGQVQLEQGRNADARATLSRGIRKAEEAGDQEAARRMNDLLSKVP
jgi:tetratricopeptide (TPR) repeat protein